jgi:hypothetical protein
MNPSQSLKTSMDVHMFHCWSATVVKYSRRCTWDFDVERKLRYGTSYDSDGND